MFLDAFDIASLQVIAIAAGLGGIVGLERELLSKPAGLRTHILICAGSALMMILGEETIHKFQLDTASASINADPVRVIHSVVIGIGFLGAGTIVQQRSHVEGLTTAATIFVTAGIGMTVAVDRAMLATVIAISTVTILGVIGAVERAVETRRRKKSRAIDSAEASD